jgi:hypothetical protein
VPQEVECLLLKWKPGVQIPIPKKKKNPEAESYQKTGEKCNIDKGKKKIIFRLYWGLYLASCLVGWCCHS